MTDQSRARPDPAALLRTYGLVSIQQMARRNGIDVKGKGKAALITLLAKSLYKGDRIKRALADLAPPEREVLHRILLSDGEVVTAMLRRNLQEEGLVEPPPDARTPHFGYHQPQGSVANKGSKRFEDIIARLSVLGLVFSRSGPYWQETIEFRTPGSTLFIPAPIRQHLPTVTPTTRTASPPERLLPGSPDDALRDIYTLVALAHGEPFPLTTQGLMTKRALVRVDAALRRPEGAGQVRSEIELGRLRWVRVLAEEMELLVRLGGELRPGPGGVGFFSCARGDRLRRLYEAYRQTAAWSELSRLRGMVISPRTGLNHPAVVTARQRVLTEIAELPPEEWITLSHLLGRLRARAYGLLLPRSELYERYRYFPEFDAERTIYNHNRLGLSFACSDGESPRWESVEGAFIREIVTEPLHWLGIVDLGTSGDEAAAQTFRVTARGAALLRGRTPALPAPETRVVIQPNFQVLAFEPADERVLFTLNRLARRVRAEQVSEYHLSRESVYAAQQEGLSSAQIITMLEQLSSMPLPQNVRRTLEDWAAHHDRIVIHRHVAAVQSDGAAILDRLEADERIGPMLAGRLAPTLALVETSARSGISALAGALLAREGRDGMPLPALSEGNDAGLIPTITVEPDGRIIPCDRVPSVYVLHDLQRVAAPDGERAFRLDVSRLRQTAREIGREYDPARVILERLELLQGGPLPEEAALMVQRWAQDWGRGVLTETVLLQVEQPEVMVALLADPTLAPHLRALPGAPTLATVEQGAVELVRAALHERGMELGSRPR